MHNFKFFRPARTTPPMARSNRNSRIKRSTFLVACSLGVSTRAAAKHTAKNANLKKTRASYYSGATADAELPFRISAKRAFHNGRPINGD